MEVNVNDSLNENTTVVTKVLETATRYAIHQRYVSTAVLRGTSCVQIIFLSAAALSLFIN